MFTRELHDGVTALCYGDTRINTYWCVDPRYSYVFYRNVICAKDGINEQLYIWYMTATVLNLLYRANRAEWLEAYHNPECLAVLVDEAHTVLGGKYIPGLSGVDYVIDVQSRLPHCQPLEATTVNGNTVLIYKDGVGIRRGRIVYYMEMLRLVDSRLYVTQATILGSILGHCVAAATYRG